MGICAFFYMSNSFGVVVFQRSIFHWRRQFSHSATGIDAFLYMSILFCVVVFQRPMLKWRGGWGQSAMGICHSLVEVYADLEETVLVIVYCIFP